VNAEGSLIAAANGLPQRPEQLDESLHRKRQNACQSASTFLCEHNGQRWFKLIPDMIVTGRYGTAILDAKWMLLDQQQPVW